MRLLLITALLCLLGCGTDHATQVLVSVDASGTAKSASSVRLVVSGAADGQQLIEVETIYLDMDGTSAGTFPFEISIDPKGDDASRQWSVGAWALNGDQEIGQGTLSGGYLDGEVTRVTLMINPDTDESGSMLPDAGEDMAGSGGMGGVVAAGTGGTGGMCKVSECPDCDDLRTCCSTIFNACGCMMPGAVGCTLPTDLPDNGTGGSGGTGGMNGAECDPNDLGVGECDDCAGALKCCSVAGICGCRAKINTGACEPSGDDNGTGGTSGDGGAETYSLRVCMTAADCPDYQGDPMPGGALQKCCELHCGYENSVSMGCAVTELPDSW